uniref:Uncharacterized protein n=1 Tax=Anguilla anguilla TaxID=7936 RepID=A0A0E9UNQ6_ANGAN
MVILPLVNSLKNPCSVAVGLPKPPLPHR